jgi:hypothetical protein
MNTMLQVKELLYNQISANGECVFSSVSQPKGSPHLSVFIRGQNSSPLVVPATEPSSYGYSPNQCNGAVVSHGTYVISSTVPIRISKNGKVAQITVPIGFLNR